MLTRERVVAQRFFDSALDQLRCVAQLHRSQLLDYLPGLLLSRVDPLARGLPSASPTLPSYTYVNTQGQNTISTIVPNTDGTVFTIDGDQLVGFDPTTGQSKFSVPMEHSRLTEDGTVYDWGNPATFQIIIAGDGFAYVPYAYYESQGATNESTWSTANTVQHLKLLRVGLDGSYTKISVKDWTASYEMITNTHLECSDVMQTAPVPAISFVNLITNADTGVTLSWEEDTALYFPSWDCAGGGQSVPEAQAYYLATTNGTTVSTSVNINFPGQTAPLQPILQREDGNYAGTVSTDSGDLMVFFDQAGNPFWSNSGYTPTYALSGGSIIATDNNTGLQVTFGPDGNTTAAGANPATVDWYGNAFATGSGSGGIVSAAKRTRAMASSPRAMDINAPAFGLIAMFRSLQLKGPAAVKNGNVTGNSVFIPEPQLPPLQSCRDNPQNGANCTGSREAIWNAYKALALGDPSTGTKAILSSNADQIQSFIFDKLKDSKGSAYQVGEFSDGVKSLAPEEVIECPKPLLSLYWLEMFLGPRVQKDFLAINGSDPDPNSDAATEAGVTPLVVFFNPNNIDSKTDAGANLKNISMLFHEALHGFTGMCDRDIQQALGCHVSNLSSRNISWYVSQVLYPTTTLPGNLQACSKSPF